MANDPTPVFKPAEVESAVRSVFTAERGRCDAIAEVTARDPTRYRDEPSAWAATAEIAHTIRGQFAG